MFPEAALIFAVPVCRLVANPVLSTVTVDSISELHVAAAVRSTIVPSVNVPRAVNCCVVPRAIDELGAVTAIDTRTAAVTVRVVPPLTEPEVAVIVVVPVPTLVANPFLLAALLTVAILRASLAHCTV
jgi:hypothetical protein